MTELPRGFSVYRQTPEFDERTIPAGLRARHNTKAGVWGRIRVLEGELTLCWLEPARADEVLTPERPGILPPGVPHQVEARGRVRFLVEFLRAAAGETERARSVE